jgi:hypothetical protein
VAADHDLAVELLRPLDDAVQVLDLDVHAPVLRVGDVRVRDQLEVVRDARVGEPAEVVVEHALWRGLALLGLVEHRLVLEQVLPALDGPDLPAVELLGDRLRERLEVGGARRRARVEDEDVARPRRARLEDADLVVLGRRARGRIALDALEADGRAVSATRHRRRCQQGE